MQGLLPPLIPAIAHTVLGEVFVGAGAHALVPFRPEETVQRVEQPRLGLMVLEPRDSTMLFTQNAQVCANQILDLILTVQQVARAMRHAKPAMVRSVRINVDWKSTRATRQASGHSRIRRCDASHGRGKG
jgi:hypothetical protein